jgi:HSP20 family protein
VWDPVAELSRIRRDLDEMFDSPGLGRFNEGLFERDFSPSLDVVEANDEYLVQVDLPGVAKKDLDISVADNVLTIKGEKHESNEKNGKVYRKETWAGTFQRTISLPHGVDSTKIDARMQDGVLTITLPKREEAKPRQIAVSVK